jgi:hypothetical protein
MMRERNLPGMKINASRLPAAVIIGGLKVR